jgi:hypothetical protein
VLKAMRRRNARALRVLRCRCCCCVCRCVLCEKQSAFATRNTHIPTHTNTQIDLDTIETSNLNRQFLFRKHHVGRSKAEVAAQVVEGFAPSARIVAHQVGGCARVRVRA